MAGYGHARSEAVMGEPEIVTGKAGVLVLCTANVCRSPMAAALLTRRLSDMGVVLPVRSAGTLGSDCPALPEVVSVMSGYGLDLSSHRSRTACAADLVGASLVLAMTRENIRHAVVTVPDAWRRAFTIKELIRRGEQIGPRAGREPLAQWLSRVHAGRERRALLGDAAEDDVADPVGGPPHANAETADLLDRLVNRLAELCWGHDRQAP